RLALGVARAREEAAEPAALGRHRRPAGLALLVGRRRRRDLLPRSVEVLDHLHRGPALGAALARAERAVAAPLDHDRLAALLARPLGGDLLALDVAHLGARLLELVLERAVEAAEQLAPVALTLLDLVEVRLHPGGERGRHDLREALDE